VFEHAAIPASSHHPDWLFQLQPLIALHAELVFALEL
jgi:hypothetical protein